MQTSRLLTIAAAASLLTVGLVWHVLENEEPGGDSVTSTTAVNYTRQSLQKEARFAPSTPHVVETREVVKAANASGTRSFRAAPASSVGRPAYRPVAQSLLGAFPVDNNRSSTPLPDQPSGAAEPLRGAAHETEFTPLYPPAFTGRAQSAPMILELDRGIRLPAAALDNKEVLSPAQAKAKDLVVAEFAEDITKAQEPSGRSSDIPENAWLQARQKADERFRAMFGDAAYNRASMQAAQEAM